MLGQGLFAVLVTVNPGDIKVTETNADGCFSLAHLPPGDHTLQVEGGAFYDEQNVSIVDGETTELEAPAT